MKDINLIKQPLTLRFSSYFFLIFWCIVAAFPIFWISVISVKLPLDAFNSNALNVIFGPATLSQGKGLSFIDITVGLAIILFYCKTYNRLVRKKGKSIFSKRLLRVWVDYWLYDIWYLIYCSFFCYYAFYPFCLK